MTRTRVLAAAFCAALAATPLAMVPVSAGGFPTADPLDGTRLLGGELLVWPFDADDLDLRRPGSVEDRSGRGAHGLRLDAPELVPGPNGFGLAYRGLITPDRVEVDDPSLLRTLRSNMTLALWVRPDTTSLNMGVFAMRDSANQVQVVVEVGIGGTVTVYLRDEGNSLVTYALGPAGTFPAGVWRHLAVTTDKDSVTLVVNGTTVNALPRSGDALFAGQVTIYASLGGCCGWHHFRGALDEFRVYPRVLTNEELQSVRSFPYFHANLPPVANAGADQVIPCEGPLTRGTLDAAASSDPEGDALTFAWSAPTASLDDPAAVATGASFSVGVHGASVVVADSEFSASDSTLVTVVDAAPPVLGALEPSAPGVYHGDARVVLGEDLVVVGHVNLTAQATDLCSAVAEVRFLVDDGTLHVDTEAPYGFTYAPEGLGLQYRTVSVVAVDAWGNASPPTSRELTVLALAPRT